MNTEKTLKVIEILTDRINDLESSLERYYGAYKAIKELLERTPECFVVSTMDGNPNEIDGKVNFEKCRMMADLLLEIQKYQIFLEKPLYLILRK